MPNVSGSDFISQYFIARSPSRLHRMRGGAAVDATLGHDPPERHVVGGVGKALDPLHVEGEAEEARPCHVRRCLRNAKCRS